MKTRPASLSACAHILQPISAHPQNSEGAAPGATLSSRHALRAFHLPRAGAPPAPLKQPPMSACRLIFSLPPQCCFLLPQPADAGAPADASDGVGAGQEDAPCCLAPEPLLPALLRPEDDEWLVENQ